MTTADIPTDIVSRVRRDFGADAEVALKQLQEFCAKSPDLCSPRLLRCIVYAASTGGYLQSIPHYIEMARTDWRDLIMTAEYDRDRNQVRDLNQPFKPWSDAFQQFVNSLYATGKAAHDDISVSGINELEIANAESLLMQEIPKDTERCILALGELKSKKALRLIEDGFLSARNRAPDKLAITYARSYWLLTQSTEAAALLVAGLQAKNDKARLRAIRWISDLPDVDCTALWANVIRNDPEWLCADAAANCLLEKNDVKLAGAGSVLNRHRFRPILANLVNSKPGEMRETVLRKLLDELPTKNA